MSKFEIGTKNFRTFKEMAEFEIRPLTVLVGPNNSGKSSFTKLLLLLKNGFRKLDFNKGDHHLGSYKQALNWDSNSNELIIKYKTKYPLLPDTFVEEIRYNEYGGIARFTITNLITKQPFIKLNIKKYESNNGFITSPSTAQFYFDIDYIIDTIRAKELIVNCPYANLQKNFTDSYQIPLKNLRKIIDIEEFTPSLTEPNKYYLEGINLENYGKSNELLESYLILNSILVNEANDLDDSNLLCEIYVNGKKIEDEERFLNLQYKIFKDREIGLYGPEDFNQPLNSILNSIPTALKNHLKQAIKEQYKDFLSNNDKISIEIKPTTLGRLLFEEKLFQGGIDPTSDNSFGFFANTFFTQITKEFFTHLNLLKNIEYIPVNRGNQDRILTSSMNTKTYQDTVGYEKNKDKKTLLHDPQKILKEILEILGIKGKISTKRLENALAVYVEKEDRKINLADYGFGYSQLIPIVLKLYNLMAEGIIPGSKFIIIEEPEANLHPNLQSKLADIFAVVLKHCEGWRLIIETHSEYLIRKLQYLTAKGDLKTKDSIIHYFNANENITKNEPKVKLIEINGEGNLTDTFGPGFYDEATRLQFELLKLNRNQSN